MPFTLSHAVLAPPLSRLTGGRLPTAALAIGCMVPDLFRLFTAERSNVTHLWSALIHPDLWIGLGFCLLWYLIYRPVIYRLSGIQHPLNIESFKSAIQFLIGVIAAVLVGTATHIIWDGLTHHDFRSFAFQDFLAQSVQWGTQTYPMHRILQIGSSILALPFLLWMSLNYYQTYKQDTPISGKIKLFALLSMAISVTGGMLAVWKYSHTISAELWNTERYFFIGKAINQFSQNGLILFSICCLMSLWLHRKAHMAEF